MNEVRMHFWCQLTFTESFFYACQDGPDGNPNSRIDFENYGFVTHARIGRQLHLQTVSPIKLHRWICNFATQGHFKTTGTNPMLILLKGYVNANATVR